MAGTGSAKLDMGGRPPRLLIVDDEPGILDLLRRRLEALGCEVAVLPGGSGVVGHAREHAPDLVLLDVMMPDVDGFTVCQQLKADAQTRDIPVVLMTARTEVASRVRGLELGAHDYVGKPFETAELIARVRAALRVKHLQDQLKQANARLERLATSDPLTDLPNRRTFDDQIFLEMERARRSGQVVSVIMLDLDRFKHINDVHGHQVGDDVLRQVGRLLAQRRRVTDLVARYGGEEFVWVLPGAKAQDAVELAEWVRRAIAEMAVETPQGRVRCTISAGVATYDPAEHGPVGATTVLETADMALRDAKATGRNRVVFREIGLEPGEPAAAEDAALDRPW
ncbi:MAG: diguanylate cyclase [Armatimonadota bacterium]|nr:diguanylate cyclase [Armatimonadota bacterium]MDR7535698.1 diguanylate cyclase [Armatimonadota bacterium]